MTHVSDSGVSAVGIKHCGDPEKWSKVASVESKEKLDVTSPTDETYITTGVGLVLGGITDVLNSTKLASVLGESCRTGLIIH